MTSAGMPLLLVANLGTLASLLAGNLSARGRRLRGPLLSATSISWLKKARRRQSGLDRAARRAPGC